MYLASLEMLVAEKGKQDDVGTVVNRDLFSKIVHLLVRDGWALVRDVGVDFSSALFSNLLNILRKIMRKQTTLMK